MGKAKFRHSSCYDSYFRTASHRHFGAIVHWLWLKAMAITESGLNYQAVSPAGAVGVMQLMPATAAEMADRLKIDNELYTPHINIELGIGYARRCWNIWEDEHGLERIRFMLGSYNAGYGNIIDAQQLAARRNLPTDAWQSIISTLPDVTGRHARETINYVVRVEDCFYKLQREGE